MLYLYIHDAEIKTGDGKPVNCDPFCLITVDNKEKQYTDVCRSSSNPKWHQSFEFKCGRNTSLSIVIYDHDTIGDLFIIAKYALNINDFQICSWNDEKFTGLSPTDTNMNTKLHISFAYIPDGGVPIEDNTLIRVGAVSYDVSREEKLTKYSPECSLQQRNTDTESYIHQPDLSSLSFQPTKYFTSDDMKKNAKKYEKLIKKKIKERKKTKRRSSMIVRVIVGA